MEYIAGWLAETAKSVGHKVSEASNAPKSKAKSKGAKGKKNNRNAGKSGSGKEVSDQGL